MTTNPTPAFELSTSTIAYSWSIAAIRVKPVYGTFTNVVSEIDWTFKGQQLASDQTSVLETHVSGTQEIDFDTQKSFTDFNNLKESQAINWVNQSQGRAVVMELRSQIQKQMTRLIEPIVASSLPW
jgi:hypothetical protein